MIEIVASWWCAEGTSLVFQTQIVPSWLCEKGTLLIIQTYIVASFPGFPDLPKPSTASPAKLQVLSINSSNVSDEVFARLAAAFKGRLLDLLDVDLSNNAKVTAASVDSLWNLTAGEELNVCRSVCARVTGDLVMLWPVCVEVSMLG